jgi:hypothetical protein
MIRMDRTDPLSGFQEVSAQILTFSHYLKRHTPPLYATRTIYTNLYERNSRLKLKCFAISYCDIVVLFRCGNGSCTGRLRIPIFDPVSASATSSTS